MRTTSPARFRDCPTDLTVIPLPGGRGRQLPFHMSICLAKFMCEKQGDCRPKPKRHRYGGSRCAVLRPRNNSRFCHDARYAQGHSSRQRLAPGGFVVRMLRSNFSPRMMLTAADENKTREGVEVKEHSAAGGCLAQEVLFSSPIRLVNRL